MASRSARWSTRSLARRPALLDDEVKGLEDYIAPLTRSLVPGLRSCLGVGQGVTATLVVTAGLGGARLRSEAAGSMRCGASPPRPRRISHPASRGRGDRQANAARHRIVRVGLRPPRPTREEVAKRGCREREVARQVDEPLVEPAGRPPPAVTS